jgi:hypothetical protein
MMAGMMPGGPQGPAAKTETRIVLSGRAQPNAKVVSFTHPSIRDPLYFNADEVEVIKAGSPQQEYNKRLIAAGKNADDIVKAATWALKKGLVREFYAGIDKALEVDPQHEAAARVVELKKKLEEALPDNPGLEQQVRSSTRVSGMQAATSKHFLLLHDTPAKAPQGKRKTRAAERLELLEESYARFLLLFQAQDVALEFPQERMAVILCNDASAFRELSETLAPTLTGSAGFYDPVRNVSVFLDQAPSPTVDTLQKMFEDNKKSADEARKNRSNPNLLRQVKTLEQLVEIVREEADVSVVSRVATLQLAANTGLLPRYVEIPAWLREGLATYFESPANSTWAGVGAVDDERLEAYRQLEKDKVHSAIDFIVADQVLEYARAQGTPPVGMGQAWALTHFLIENHPRELVNYYRMLAQMPPDLPLHPRLLTDLFSRVFGADRTAIDQEWRQFMRSLKTDVERLEDNSGSKGRS